MSFTDWSLPFLVGVVPILMLWMLKDVLSPPSFSSSWQELGASMTTLKT